MNIQIIIYILAAIAVSLSVLLRLLSTTSTSRDRDRETGEYELRHGQDRRLLEHSLQARSSNSLSPSNQQLLREKNKRIAEDKNNAEQNFGREDISSTLLDLGGGGARSLEGGGGGGGGGGKESLINHRFNKLFELEDAATRNTWTGPDSDTKDINWYCITSDSQGKNLAAGSDSAIHISLNGGKSWVESNGAPTESGTNWQAIASSSSGQFVVAGNQGGQIWTSIDYGQSFNKAALQGSSGQFFSLGSLAMSSDGTKVIAALFGLGVALYNFNTTSGNISLIGSIISSVNETSVNKAQCLSSDPTFDTLNFAVSSGGIYYSTNGGSSWLQSDAPAMVTAWTGITSSANGKYLAACTYSSGIYYSKDSGATWVPSNWNPSTMTTSSLYVNGIASSASGQTMIAAVGNGKEIYLSYDYGQLWIATNSNSDSRLKLNLNLNSNSNPGANWTGVAVSDDGGTMYGVNFGGAGIYESNTAPTSQPSSLPTLQPSRPSLKPTENPTCNPTAAPTSFPTEPSSQPSSRPSSEPSQKPSSRPSVVPSVIPSTLPTLHPSVLPSCLPSTIPTGKPSTRPSFSPTSKPTFKATASPTVAPSTAAPTVAQQQSDANALCAFKKGIINWPGNCTVSGWSCNDVIATSVACISSTPAWSGVSCYNNAVLGLTFESCGFTGTISSKISRLSKINEIYLSNNSFASSIPTQISVLHALHSLYLNNNDLTGSAGSFLCTNAMTSADNSTTPLQLQNNQLSCIESCAQAIAGSGHYDASTPVCTAKPTLQPSSPGGGGSSSSADNDDGNVNVSVASPNFYVAIMLFFFSMSLMFGFLIARGRLKHTKDSINEVSVIDLYCSPMLAFLFFGNWVYSIAISLLYTKSYSNALIIINILSVLVRLSTIVLVSYIQKFMNDPVSSYSLFHKMNSEKSVTLKDSQFLFLQVSFVMYAKLDSVKLLPWKRNTFTAVSGGYPCYWLFVFCLKYQLLFSICCLIIVIARIVVLHEDSASNIINIIFTFLYIISLRSAGIYATIRGKLAEDFEMFDDDDDEVERRKFANRLLSTGNQEMVDFRPSEVLTSHDILKEAQKDIAAVTTEEDGSSSQGVFDIDVIADRFNVILAEQEAIKEQEAAAAAAQQENEKESDSSRSTSSSVATKEDTDILENQLKELGVQPLRFIKLDEIRAEIADILQRQERKEKTDEKRLDYLLRCLGVNPEYIEEKKREKMLWIQEVMPQFKTWYDEMSKFVPSRVNKLSVVNLVQAGLPQKLANRLYTKKCLWLIKMAPEKIRKIHISDLRGKYSYQSQGLDIAELAAIYLSLPQTFEDDGRGDKMRFKTELEDKLKVMYKDKKTSRNPVYTNVDMSHVQLDVDDRITFSDNSQRPTLADLTQDVAAADLESQPTQNPMFSSAGGSDVDGRRDIPTTSSSSNLDGETGSLQFPSSSIMQSNSLSSNRNSSIANRGSNLNQIVENNIGRSSEGAYKQTGANSSNPRMLATPNGLMEQLKQRQQKRLQGASDLTSEANDDTSASPLHPPPPSPSRLLSTPPNGLMEQLKQQQIRRQQQRSTDQIAEVEVSNNPASELLFIAPSSSIPALIERLEQDQE